jgi:hypothetical protein
MIDVSASNGRQSPTGRDHNSLEMQLTLSQNGELLSTSPEWASISTFIEHVAGLGVGAVVVVVVEVVLLSSGESPGISSTGAVAVVVSSGSSLTATRDHQNGYTTGILQQSHQSFDQAAKYLVSMAERSWQDLRSWCLC